MSIRKTVKKACGVGLVLGACMASGSVFADIADSFEGGTVGNSDANWGDNGKVTTETSAVGSTTSPLPNAGSFTQALAITGTVTRTVSLTPTSGNGVKADFMVKVTKPDEALAADTIGDPTGVQIAIAADYVESGNVPLKIWTTTNNSAQGWVSLGNGFAYAENSWKRITLLFDYGNRAAQVLVDSKFATGGYASSACSGTAGSGAWFKFANAASATALNSIQVVGTTAIDDVAVASTSLTDPKPFPKDQKESVNPVSGGTAIAVEKNDMVKWGVDATTINTKVDETSGSGLTYFHEVAAGITPETPNTQFKITAMAPASGNENKVTLTVPQLTPATGYKNVIRVTTGGESTDTPIASNATTVDVPFPSVSEGSAVKSTYKLITTVETK